MHHLKWIFASNVALKRLIKSQHLVVLQNEDEV